MTPLLWCPLCVGQTYVGMKFPGLPMEVGEIVECISCGQRVRCVSKLTTRIREPGQWVRRHECQHAYNNDEPAECQ